MEPLAALSSTVNMRRTSRDCATLRSGLASKEPGIGLSAAGAEYWVDERLETSIKSWQWRYLASAEVPRGHLDRAGGGSRDVDIARRRPLDLPLARIEAGAAVVEFVTAAVW